MRDEISMDGRKAEERTEHSRDYGGMEADNVYGLSAIKTFGTEVKFDSMTQHYFPKRKALSNGWVFKTTICMTIAFALSLFCVCL